MTVTKRTHRDAHSMYVNIPAFLLNKLVDGFAWNLSSSSWTIYKVPMVLEANPLEQLAVIQEWPAIAIIE